MIAGGTGSVEDLQMTPERPPALAPVRPCRPGQNDLIGAIHDVPANQD